MTGTKLGRLTSIFDTVWAENALASLSDKSTTKTAISTPYFLENYFVDGGTLSSRTPSYVIRKADDELLSGILTGELCYVLTSRQMGKSSLMIRIASRLRELGYLAALIDIQVIGTTTEQEWYRSFLSQLRRRLRLKADIEEWWEQQQTLSSPQKLFNFFSDVILGEISENVVIFVDEIDSALRLPFRDDFFAFIRAFYNSRATNREARRLSFVLLGVASPADLIADQARTPFNIGREIKLTDFSFEEAVVLRSAIESIYPGKGEIIYKRIFYWTDGHPYLTQKLCKLAAENQNTSWDTHAIDELVKQLFLIDIYDTNLSFIRDIIIRNPEKRKMLSLYRSIYQGKKVIVDRSSLIQNQLLLSGIVKEKNGFLEVRNNIYRQRFNLAWIRENSPFNLFDRIFGV